SRSATSYHSRLIGISRSAKLGPDRAVVGLGDKEGAVGGAALGGRPPGLGFGRAERGKALLLIAGDARLPWFDRDQLRKAIELPQPERMQPRIKAGIGAA